MKGWRVPAVLASLCALALPVVVAASTETVGAATLVTTEAELEVAVANGAETSITLGNDITLTCAGAGQLDRSENTNALTIDGVGATLTQSCAGFRVLLQSGTAPITFVNLDLVGANNGWSFGGVVFAEGDVTLVTSSLTGGNGAGQGAGIWSDGNVELLSSTISDNTGTNGGAGIWAAGDVTITRSEISGNTATDSSGGAVQTEGSISAVDSLFVDNHATGGGSGGAFDADDGVSVSTSSFFSNSAGDGGGAIRSFGPVSITSSYFRENSTEGDSGGGGAVDGGQGGPIDVVNSTFTENSAGAAFGGGIIGGDIHLVYSDVVRNGAAAGANLAWEGQLTSFGSVVALPGDGGQNCFFAGGSTSAGYNFSDDASCNFTATGDRQNAGDPMLPIFGSPDAQGSICIDSICASTFGLIPLSGSPLVDAIPVAACRDDGAAAVTTDVFGTSRPQGNGCDIGAVEALVTAPPPGPPMQPPIITPRFTG